MQQNRKNWGKQHNLPKLTPGKYDESTVPVQKKKKYFN